VDDPFHSHRIGTDPTGKRRAGRRWMEIEMNGKDSEKKKEGESETGASQRFFDEEEQKPKDQKDRDKSKEGRMGEGQVEGTNEKPQEVNNEDGNERKAKGLLHFISASEGSTL
jgi:hypothetical protein